MEIKIYSVLAPQWMNIKSLLKKLNQIQRTGKCNNDLMKQTKNQEKLNKNLSPFCTSPAPSFLA